MTLIFTIDGYVNEDSLVFTKGTDESDTAWADWEEWRDATGRIVKRNAHVRLKWTPEVAALVGQLGG